MNASDQKAAREKRQEIRYPTTIRARLTHRQPGMAVTIRDISAHGILILGAELPEANEHIRIQAKALDQRGHVVWMHNGQCGIMFDQPIEPLAVVRQNLNIATGRREPSKGLA